MELVEKKKALLNIVEDADEKLTGLLIALANEYNDSAQTFTKEELEFFNNRRNTFFDNGKIGSSIEEVHNRIRGNYHNGL